MERKFHDQRTTLQNVLARPRLAYLVLDKVHRGMYEYLVQEEHTILLAAGVDLRLRDSRIQSLLPPEAHPLAGKA